MLLFGSYMASPGLHLLCIYIYIFQLGNILPCHRTKLLLSCPMVIKHIHSILHIGKPCRLGKNSLMIAWPYHWHLIWDAVEKYSWFTIYNNASSCGVYLFAEKTTSVEFHYKRHVTLSREWYQSDPCVCPVILSLDVFIFQSIFGKH